jgi:hypothetical protein
VPRSPGQGTLVPSGDKGYDATTNQTYEKEGLLNPEGKEPQKFIVSVERPFSPMRVQAIPMMKWTLRGALRKSTLIDRPISMSTMSNDTPSAVYESDLTG